jgi:SAM-dependent methyltransferase
MSKEQNQLPVMPVTNATVSSCAPASDPGGACGCGPTSLTDDQVRQNVRATYAAIAEGGGSCCSPGQSDVAIACGAPPDAAEVAREIGYDLADLADLPAGANLGLGCGNPQAIAQMQAGEWIVDLGSGAGVDCFLAAKKIGTTGRAIGVDMTPSMVTKARNNAASSTFKNVEFRLGEIENLPVADGTADVIISNCVVNLSPNKGRVFAEAFRVLKPGGRVAISDVVLTAQLPAEILEDPMFHSGCISGAEPLDVLEQYMREAGFADVQITPKDSSRELIKKWAPGTDLGAYIVSAAIEGKKPSN